jgi:hypothetical protein
MVTAAGASAAGLLHFNGEVRFGDLLTAASILVAALTLYISFWQARLQQRRDLADAIRTAAADALAKLDRYARIPEVLTESAQDLAVEVSRMIVGSSAIGDVEKARDHAWSELSKDWQAVRAAQRAEGVELAHVRLLGSRPDAYHGVAESIRELDRRAFECFEELQKSVQDKTLGYSGKGRSAHTAQVGDALRACLEEYGDAITRNSESALASVRVRLRMVIGGTDREVVNRG